MSWNDKYEKCPICKKNFYDSDVCKHGRGDLQDYEFDNKVRKVVQMELKKAGLI